MSRIFPFFSHPAYTDSVVHHLFKAEEPATVGGLTEGLWMHMHQTMMVAFAKDFWLQSPSDIESSDNVTSELHF